MPLCVGIKRPEVDTGTLKKNKKKQLLWKWMKTKNEDNSTTYIQDSSIAVSAICNTSLLLV